MEDPSADVAKYTKDVRNALDQAFKVAWDDIQNGKTAKSETMHAILNATFAAIEGLSEAIDLLAERIA